MKKLMMLLALVPTMVLAQNNDFFTGNELWSRLNADDTMSKSVALGYIAGVASAASNSGHCAPRTVTMGQVQDVVKTFMQSAPEHRHLSASVIVLAALINVWPCANTKGL